MPRSTKRKAASPPDAAGISVKRCAKSKRRSNPPVSILCALPEELLLEILDLFLDSLYDATDVKALYSLCLTNRQFYRLTNSYLYNVIDNRLCDSRRLLGTLVREPHMASKIRNLAFLDEHGEPLSTEARKERYTLTHIERRQLCKKVEELGITNPRLYSRVFKNQKSKDVLAAMLLLAPRIQSLDVSDQNACCNPRGYIVDPAWIRILAEVGFNESPPLAHHFQHLHTIRISMGPIKFNSIAPILGIASLRTLMLDDVYHRGEVMQWLWDLAVEPRSSLLENLYLESSYVDSKAVVQLLHSIKGLRLFVFEFDNAFRSALYRLYDDVPPKLDYPTLTAAILDHKDSLQQLSIENSADPDLLEVWDIGHGTLDSLRGMHKVRFMDVGLDCFTTLRTTFNELDDSESKLEFEPANLADKLPPGLTQLDLNINEDGGDEYEGYWAECLEDLANACEAKLPILKEIKVSRKRFGPIDTRSGLRDLKKLFEDRGVSLMVEQHCL